jgi:4-amino-4-deoxy-L-arabinose transferase-like glycosyltransferase/putative flippase GtrA
MKVIALRTGVPVLSRIAPFAKFLLVGLSGILVNELLYVALVDRLAIFFVVSAIVATQASTTWNFLGNELWAFSGRHFVGPTWVRYISYSGMNNALLLLRVPMLWLLADFAHVGSAWSNLITLGALFLVRYAVSDGLVWRREGQGSSADEKRGSAAAWITESTYRYDIGGLLRLDSETELPELAYFRSPSTTPPDIRIRIRRVGSIPKLRVQLQSDGDRVTYREHLGILGADFNVTMGHPIEIEASPLLGLSRHVLYTNVVEALLRFVLVSKGYVLLHSAGLAVDGRASLLSAQTDTGKTSTVINMVRERGWGFISDDMAIIDPSGFVRTFPKPMTLSYHTMTRAVDASTLSPKKRVQLQVQSRVHSKSGRTVGKGLGSLNVPIMSINSALQIVVPPPKYHITSLLPAQITAEAPIDNVFLMERGEPVVQERVDLGAAIDQLIDNTDDAYGFPPFATLAPTFVIGGRDYQQLRARERELLTQAMANATIWRLRVRGHEWGELLPRLIAEGRGRELVGIPIEPERRVPVGIPIESEGAPALPFGGEYAAAAAYEAADNISYAAPYMGGKRGDSFSGGRVSPGMSGFAAGAAKARFEDRLSSAGLPRRGNASSGATAMAIGPYGGFGTTSGVARVPGNAVTRDRARSDARAISWTWLALGAILFVAAAARLWALNSVGFNNDEAVYTGQGAALAADPIYSGLFAIFRAHPLLVQFLDSLAFRVLGVGDVAPRLISVAFGLGAVGLVYATGTILYTKRAGLIAAAVLALMPYHVIVTRQALLDGPETTLFLLTIYLLARYARGSRARWLYASAFSAGLTVLAKETAILLVPVIIAFLLLAPEIRVSIRRLLVAAALFVLAFGPYPFAILIGKGTNAAQAFFVWQVLRQPNHTWTFYADVLPATVGPLVVIAAAVGLLIALRRAHWQDRLLIAWVAVPIAFFEVWPVKGFQYLLPIAPAIAILVGLTFDRLFDFGSRLAQHGPATGEGEATAEVSSGRTVTRRRSIATAACALVLALIVGSIAIPTALAVNSTTMTGSLAGTGGLPGGRDAGLWIRDNVPAGAAFLTTGPTLGNIVEFYGQRQAYGLSVSPNPLRRNPAYDPIVNPDRALQLNRIQYIATDIWSAQRSPFFASLLNRYITRYHGWLVYQQSAEVRDDAGNASTQVVIKIYEVRP